jgi:hypothetical protein
MKSCCRSDSSPVAAFFCRITRSLPTSVPACSVKRLFGSRMADTGSQRFISHSRTGRPCSAFNTPCEVMNATRPPSRTISTDFMKK